MQKQEDKGPSGVDIELLEQTRKALRRLDRLLERLKRKGFSSINPDLSTSDLVEILRHERDRLLLQLNEMEEKYPAEAAARDWRRRPTAL